MSAIYAPHLARRHAGRLKAGPTRRCCQVRPGLVMFRPGCCTKVRPYRGNAQRISIASNSHRVKAARGKRAPENEPLTEPL